MLRIVSDNELKMFALLWLSSIPILHRKCKEMRKKVADSYNTFPENSIWALIKIRRHWVDGVQI